MVDDSTAIKFTARVKGKDEARDGGRHFGWI